MSGVSNVLERIVVERGDRFAIFVKPGRVFRENVRSKLLSFRGTPMFDGNVDCLSGGESLIAYGVANLLCCIHYWIRLFRFWRLIRLSSMLANRRWLLS